MEGAWEDASNRFNCSRQPYNRERHIQRSGLGVTIQIPPKNIFDKILALCGRRRGVIIPAEAYEKFGQYVHASARRENFFKAIIRPRNSPFPEGVLDWDEAFDHMSEKHQRHEILFCHDFLSFLECQFPGAKFGDDLQGHSRAELYFIHDSTFYLVEVKSEAETEGSKHPGWKGSFQEIRDIINSLQIENRYNKWLLYLAQLNEYAFRSMHRLRESQCDERKVMLGLPLNQLADCKCGIEMAIQSSVFSKFSYECGQDFNRRVAYVVTQEASLSEFFDIKKGK
jgi:hypothetical protein